MNENRPASPPPKRFKLESSPSPSFEPEEHVLEPNDAESLEQEHCSICLQAFLDRTIIPTCAHEFCFECILLWSEQSRKCPLCSRSFENSYLIHHIRSTYDYQKHYLPPSRSSPPLLPTGESRARALRNTRREREWGRRARQQRDQVDQLERAIARRRWIYQHDLYAKHVASNSYTRYRPFPTPIQFAASPDLISRMTIFLRRELHVWPDLDVEFLTTFTVSLMKSIDIRSESAVKLLSEFLDLDAPYVEGGRHVNAEHFAHEIYCYLRSPYRDLNTYDKTAQYDTPPDIPPPHEIERGSRWIEESPRRSRSPRSPPRRSRSRSNSGYRSPPPRRENRATHTSPAEHHRDDPAEGRDTGRQPLRHRRGRSRSRELPDLERHHRDDGYYYRSAHQSRSHSPGRDKRQDDSRAQPAKFGDRRLTSLRDGDTPYPTERFSTSHASSSAVRIEDQDDSLPTTEVLPRVIKGKQKETEIRQEESRSSGTPKFSTPGGDDPATATAAALQDPGSITCTLIEALSSSSGAVGEVGNRGEKVQEGSLTRVSRNRLASAVVRPPRNRTLLESVQAHLARPVVPRRATEPKEKSVGPGHASENDLPARHSGSTSNNTNDTVPTLLLRISDAPTNPGNTSPTSHDQNSPPTPLLISNATAAESSAGRPQISSFSSSDCGKKAPEHRKRPQSSEFLARSRTKMAKIKLKDQDEQLDPDSTLPLLPSRGASPSADRSPAVPPPYSASAAPIPVQPIATPPISDGTSSLSSASYSRIRSIQNSQSQASPPHAQIEVVMDNYSQRGNEEVSFDDGTESVMSASDMRSTLLRKLKEEQRRALDDHPVSNHPTPHTAAAPLLLGTASSPRPSSCPQQEIVADNGSQGLSSVCGVNNEASDLEAKLRARALLRVRLAAIKGTVNAAIGSSPTQNANDNSAGRGSDDGDNRSSNEDAISSHREEALRDKLQERRV